MGNLGENVRKNIGAQSLRGKILSRKELVLICFLSKIEMQLLGFQSEEIRVNGKREETGTAFPFWEARAMEVGN